MQSGAHENNLLLLLDVGYLFGFRVRSIVGSSVGIYSILCSTKIIISLLHSFGARECSQVTTTILLWVIRTRLRYFCLFG